MDSLDGFQHLQLTSFDNRDDLLAPHCGESREKLFDGLVAFQTVDQVL